MGVDPQTVMQLSTGLQLASGIAGYAADTRADQQRQQIADQEAANARADAASKAQQELRLANTQEHTQRMLYLKSGVDLVGSPLLAMEETRNKGEQNAQNVIDSGNRTADTIAANGRIKRASFVNSALGTASGIASTYTNYQLLQRQIK